MPESIALKYARLAPAVFVIVAFCATATAVVAEQEVASFCKVTGDWLWAQ